MARNKVDWGQTQNEYIKNILLTEKSFTVSKISEELKYSMGIVRKHMAVMAKEMGIKVRSLWTKDVISIIPMTEEEKITLRNREPKRKPGEGMAVSKHHAERKKLKTRYHCKCQVLTTGEELFLTMAGVDKDEATVRMNTEYINVKVLNIYSPEEYSRIKPKNRLLTSKEYV